MLSLRERRTWAPPGRHCPSCGKRHRTWHAVARCRWRRGLTWCQGDPAPDAPCWAVVSRCPHYRGPCTTVSLWPTMAQAESVKLELDETGCGAICWRLHDIHPMRST
jgi:hypothetical protein